MKSLHHGVVLGVPVAAAVLLSLSVLSFTMTRTNPMPTDTKPVRLIARGELSKCLSLLFSDDIEGGFVNDPRDPGGPTNHGLSLRAVKDQLKAGKLTTALRILLDKNQDDIIDVEDVRLWTKTDAEAFYAAYYWRPIRGFELPARFAMMVFDSAVNEGVVTAIRHFQASLGVKVDGIMGPETIGAANALAAADDASEACDLVTANLTSRRLDRYRTLMNADIYFRGWARRSVITAVAASRIPVWAD